MKVIYSDNKLDFTQTPTIMLCGPTPRSPEVKSWRPTALDIFRDLNFKGTVFVPEISNWSSKFNYEDQVEWEWGALENCSAIVFWVPRDLKTMPAMTTNVEFGGYVRSGRAWYGRPYNSPKNDYLDWLYGKTTGRTPFNNLRTLLEHVVRL